MCPDDPTALAARPAPPFRVKICGLTEAKAVALAGAEGASFWGFVRSPRFVASERPAELVADLPRAVRTAGVTVDPTEAFPEHALGHVPPDVLQLHGLETPELVRAIALRTGCLEMNAIRIGEAADLEGLEAFYGAADLLLFDTRRRPGPPGPAATACPSAGRGSKVWPRLCPGPWRAVSMPAVWPKP